MRNDIERLVFELGGKKVVADHLLIHSNTVRGWELAGRIPKKYHASLLDLAADFDITSIIERYLK